METGAGKEKSGSMKERVVAKGEEGEEEEAVAAEEGTGAETQQRKPVKREH